MRPLLSHGFALNSLCCRHTATFEEPGVEQNPFQLHKRQDFCSAQKDPQTVMPGKKLKLAPRGPATEERVSEETRSSEQLISDPSCRRSTFPGAHAPWLCLHAGRFSLELLSVLTFDEEVQRRARMRNFQLRFLMRFLIRRTNVRPSQVQEHATSLCLVFP